MDDPGPTPRLADTPEPPYYAVIFSSLAGADRRGYEQTANRMLQLAARQPGFLGVESAGGTGPVSTTVSYWRDLDSIHRWRDHAEHSIARDEGRRRWYKAYRLRIARVERASSFSAP